jgi:hypothetical protein
MTVSVYTEGSLVLHMGMHYHKHISEMGSA